MEEHQMRKKMVLPILAALMVLALCAPAVAAGGYPQNGQFLVGGSQIPTEGYQAPTLTPADYEAMYQAVPRDLTAVGSRQVGTSSPSDSWEQFAKDAQHTGFATGDAPDTNTLAWSADIKALGASSTVFADGKIFVYNGYVGFDGSGDTNLSALDEYTGQVLWNTSIPQPDWGSWSSPAYHNSFVYTSTANETKKIDASNGTVIWTFSNPSGSSSCNGGPAIADGLVFCSDWDGGHYYCLYEENGTIKWTFNVVGYAQGTPAYDNGAVYLTSWSSGGHVYAVNAETGTQIWHNGTLAQNCCGSASVAGNLVYVTTYNFGGDGEIAALSKATGEIVWQQPIQRTDSTPAIAYGNVYVTGGCEDFSPHQTYCFDALTGTPIWATNTTYNIGGWTCSVAVADGKVYVGGESSNGTLFNYDRTFALNASTGNIVWYYPQGGATPSIHDGRVFTVGNNGALYAFG